MGIHSFKRVSPFCRKGKIHTSLVLVSVLEKSEYKHIDIELRDTVTRVTKDSGAGGQHRNKTESAVYMTDSLTGISVKEAKKCQHKNRKRAKEKLAQKLNNHYKKDKDAKDAVEKKQQIGNASRSKKIRVYDVEQNTVTNLHSGKKTTYTNLLKGKLSFVN